MKKISFSMLLALLLVSLLGPWSVAQANSLPAIKVLSPQPSRIDGRLLSQLDALQQADMTTVIVTLRQQADLTRVNGSTRAARQQGVIRALQATAATTQKPLKDLLKKRQSQGMVSTYTSLWVFNGISVTGTAAVIAELSQQPDVYLITSDALRIVPSLGTADANLSLVNAPALWSLGYTGQGVVVANLDSGVDESHPDLASRWRGGSNSWYDPYGEHLTLPTDLTGHGTQTMGIMVGGDASGTSIGMAPNAKWIAARIFNDAGASTATAIHLAFQWLLDPDGNPATADAPDVVNNSWTYANIGCYLDFEPDLQSLRAVGILPVFAAGNGGPSGNTSYSPSNNPSAFAVGAIDNNSRLYGLSSRGPTTCGGSTGPYPDLVAPGVKIRTTDLFSTYTNAYSGTSYAAPHVAGGLALLLSAHPNLSAAEQERALLNSATDLGTSGPDDSYGYGRLDVLGALNWLASVPSPTPTAIDTSIPIMTETVTPAPASTSTSIPTYTFTPISTDTATPLPTNTFTPVPTYTLTAIPTFTSTPKPTATFTSTPASILVHIGDLDRTSTLSGTKWNAAVTILVHNAAEGLVANATITGKWTNGGTGTVTCVTNASGLCTVSKTGLAIKTTSVTLSITGISGTSLTYQSTSNHDPDGDSTGTMIVVSKP